MIKAEENKKGYKKTSLGWIPEDWDVKKLCELGEFKNGINKDKEQFGHGYPLVNLMDVFDKQYVKKSQFGLVNSTDQERQEYELKKGDILFVRSSVKPAGVGLTSLVIEDIPDSVFSGFLIRFRDNGTLQFDYKSHCFYEKDFRKNLLRKSTISANTNINQEALKSLLIPIPSFEEQQNIGNILNSWDYAIENTEKIVALKEKRKKAFMQQLLTGKKRLKGFDRKWKNKNLGDILIPTLRPVNKPNNNYIALGIRSHGKGTFLKNDFDPEDIDIETLYEVKENDLIVNITFAWEGAIAIAKKEDDGALVSHRFPTYTFNSTYGTVDFFRYIIIQPRFKYLLETISPGGAGRNRVLSKKDFLKLEVSVPSVEEQLAIANILLSTDKEIKLLKQKLELLKKQKQGLMQALLTGKVRVI